MDEDPVSAFAYTVPDGTALLHAADAAEDLGFGDEIDRDLGRHGISNALFRYLRDPYQHRTKLFTTRSVVPLKVV